MARQRLVDREPVFPWCWARHTGFGTEVLLGVDKDSWFLNPFGERKTH